MWAWCIVMAEESNRVHRPEERGRLAEVTPEVRREMLKPLWFGNHQMKYKLFSYLVSAGKPVSTRNHSLDEVP